MVVDLCCSRSSVCTDLPNLLGHAVAAQHNVIETNSSSLGTSAHRSVDKLDDASGFAVAQERAVDRHSVGILHHRCAEAQPERLLRPALLVPKFVGRQIFPAPLPVQNPQ